MSRELEAVLRRSGTLTPQELELSVGQASARKVPLWDVLVLERRVPEDTIAEAFSRWLKLPRVRLGSIVIEAAAVKAVTGAVVRKHTCLPVRLTGEHLVLAMANPLDRQAIQDVQFASSRVVQPVVACRTEILTGIEEHYSSRETTAADLKTADGDALTAVINERDVVDLDQTEPLQSTGISPIVQLCNRIVLDAINLQASDIHIEPGPEDVRVRLRVDGVLRDYHQFPHWTRSTLMSRVKILAKLDIAQQRVPQDGRIKARTNGRSIDVRVSTLPTQFGEKAVLRLLGSASTPTLSALGLSAEERTLLGDAVSQPQGLILVTGPTGAGKSTTLYSMLMHRQSPEVNIVTIEDPIEYQLPGANQVQVDVKAGVSFAGCLRAVLRQDPDIIMVGEIRDLETAVVAFQAALTGHLVLSTLHTNGSVAAIERLLDLGVSPLMMTAATNVVIAQRLARRICMKCREPYVPSASALRKLRLEKDGHEFWHGRGCEACGHTGYSGRIGIFEMLSLTTPLKDLVRRRATESEIKHAAVAGGTRFLLTDALDKVRQGLTTVEEIQRVIRIDHADDRPSPNDPQLPGLEITKRRQRARPSS